MEKSRLLWKVFEVAPESALKVTEIVEVKNLSNLFETRMVQTAQSGKPVPFDHKNAAESGADFSA